MSTPTRRTSACSFCGKQQAQVQRLIAGPGPVFICDECVRLCNEIITEEPRPPVAPSSRTVDPRTRSEPLTSWWRRWLPGQHHASSTTATCLAPAPGRSRGW